MTLPKRGAAEQAVFDQFLGRGAYQAFGCCANPACETPHERAMTAGATPSSRVCVVCFEFVFNCAHPSRRLLDSLGRRV